MALETKFTALVEKNSTLQEREKTLTEELENVTKLGGKDSRTSVIKLSNSTCYDYELRYASFLSGNFVGFRLFLLYQEVNIMY